MKTKITLIILELPDSFHGVIPTVKTIVDSSNKFPCGFVSAGSVEMCLDKLCSEICNVHLDFVSPKLMELTKDGPSIVEAIYCGSIPKDIVSCRNDYLLQPLENIFLEDKYGYCIRQIPRLTGG